MALTSENENGMVMPVMPMGGYGNDGMGFGGGSGWWILLLFILLGGWNNGFGGNGGGVAPVLSVDNSVQRGFDQSAIMSGLGDINGAVTGGFAGIQQSLMASFANAETAANARQMADIQQMFANQTAMNQGFNAVQGQLAQCCCDNRLATCQTQNTIVSDGAATRLAIQNQTQAILDKMCQQEIDAYRRENENLRTQVNMQNLAASQAAQTAALIADNTAQTQYIVNRVAPYPIPAYTVPNPSGVTTG